MRTFLEMVKTYAPAILLIAGGFLLAWQFVDPAPGNSITISSGSADGAYSRFAERYKQELAKNGVTLTILPSNGSAENVSRLEQQTTDVAFVQGGVTGSADSGLQSLGSLYFEPIWVFSRAPLTRLAALKGERIAIGGEGSGTRPVALQLLAGNGVSAQNATLLDLSGQAAADALLAGKADAVFFVASPGVAYIQALLSSERIHLMGFSRAAAYARLYPYLASVSLPQGALDLARDIPANDTTLLATTATLVIRSDLHPDLQNLLLQAAAAVHGKRGLFEIPGEFPSQEYVQFPLSAEADRYYRYGPPLLQKYLPFWTANMIDRLKIMLLPLLALLLPLIKVMPPIYTWRVRSRIYHWYDDLQHLDQALHAADSPEEVARLRAELAAMQSEILNVHVPAAYMEELYHLRMHCALVSKKNHIGESALL